MLAPGGLGSPETATRVFGLDEIGSRQGEHFLNRPQGMFKKEKRVLPSGKNPLDFLQLEIGASQEDAQNEDFSEMQRPDP